MATGTDEGVVRSAVVVRLADPQRILDPIVEHLLDRVDVTVPALPVGNAVNVGTSAATELRETLASLVPIPMDGAALANAVADLPVKARSLGGAGWEVTISLPRIEFSIPELDAGKVTVDGTEAHVVKDAAAGPVKLVIDAGGAGAPVLTLRAPAGADIAVSLGSAAVSITPGVIALPFGFGVSVGPIELSVDGISISDVGFYLPPIPRLPVGKIGAPVSIGALTSALPGIDLETPDIDFPYPDAAVPAELRLFVQRPTARTLLDLVPTKVSFALPLDGGSFAIDASHPVDPVASGGGTLRIRGELGVTDSGATLHAELEGVGGDDGLATIGGPSLALAAGIAPHLLPPDARDAAATAIIAAVASGQLPGAGGDGDVVIHALSLDAAWSPLEAAPPTVTVKLDYEARLGIDVSAGGMGVHTTKPMRVRYRDVGVDLAVPPLLTWADSPMSLVSPGDWEVDGIPEDLLRIGDIRTGKGCCSSTSTSRRR